VSDSKEGTPEEKPWIPLSELFAPRARVRPPDTSARPTKGVGERKNHRTGRKDLESRVEQCEAALTDMQTLAYGSRLAQTEGKVKLWAGEKSEEVFEKRARETELLTTQAAEVLQVLIKVAEALLAIARELELRPDLQSRLESILDLQTRLNAAVMP
jgi:hypothetical protein